MLTHRKLPTTLGDQCILQRQGRVMGRLSSPPPVRSYFSFSIPRSILYKTFRMSHSYYPLPRLLCITFALRWVMKNDLPFFVNWGLIFGQSNSSCQTQALCWVRLVAAVFFCFFFCISKTKMPTPSMAFRDLQCSSFWTFSNAMISFCRSHVFFFSLLFTLCPAFDSDLALLLLSLFPFIFPPCIHVLFSFSVLSLFSFIFILSFLSLFIVLSLWSASFCSAKLRLRLD